MSIDATRWAWIQDVPRATHKLVLLALADRAGADNTAFPSISCLSDDTKLDRKTICACLSDLCRIGKIEDTEQRVGKTAQITVYRLIGVEDRHGNNTENGTVKETQKRNSSKNGTVPFLPRKSTVFPSKEYQKRDTEPTKEPIKEPTSKKIPPLPPKGGSDTPPKKSRSRETFVPPTVADVAAHVAEKGYHFDPEAFVAHYQTTGWKLRAGPMRDWKAACVTWEKNARNRNGNGNGKSSSKPGLMSRPLLGEQPPIEETDLSSLWWNKPKETPTP